MFQDIRQWTNFVYEVHPTVRVKELLLLYVFDKFYIYLFTINSCYIQTGFTIKIHANRILLDSSIHLAMIYYKILFVIKSS